MWRFPTEKSYVFIQLYIKLTKFAIDFTGNHANPAVNLFTALNGTEPSAAMLPANNASFKLLINSFLVFGNSGLPRLKPITRFTTNESNVSATIGVSEGHTMANRMANG